MANSRLDPARFETVRLRELISDPTFNRPLREGWLAKLEAQFDVSRLGRIAVSRREDGSLVLIDGQHRVEVLRRKGVPEDTKVIPADVYSDLSREQEAELFVYLNNTKMVSAYDKFHALRAAGDVETCTINRIVEMQGLRVGIGAKDGVVGCIDALRRLYSTGEPKGAILARTLSTADLAWGTTHEAYSSALLRGIGLYLNSHRDVESNDLAEALVRGPGAPIHLIGWAKGIAGTQRMSMDKAIALVIETRVVNRRRRPRKVAAK